MSADGQHALITAANSELSTSRSKPIDVTDSG